MSTALNTADGQRRSSDFIAVALTAGMVFFLSEQRFSVVNFPLLERSAVFLVAILVLITLSQLRLQVIYFSLPVIGLAVAIAISLIWQPNTGSAADALGYQFALVFAVVLINAYGAHVALRGVVLALFVLVSLNLFIFALEPSRIPTGSFIGSNTLAASVLILMPALVGFTLRSVRSTVMLRTLGLAASITVIVLTRASTELAVAVMMLIAWGVFTLHRKFGSRGRIVVWTLFALIPFGAAVAWPALLAFRGKNSSLSGRTEIWEVYLNMILQRPIQGYGWSIQTTPEMPLGAAVAKVVGAHIHNAHNDYLNWWAHTGVFGLALYISALVLIVISSFRLAHSRPHVAIWAFLTGVVFALNGLAEMTSYFADGWLLLCLVSTALAAETFQQQEESAGLRTIGFARVHLPLSRLK